MESLEQNDLIVDREFLICSGRIDKCIRCNRDMLLFELHDLPLSDSSVSYKKESCAFGHITLTFTQSEKEQLEGR